MKTSQLGLLATVTILSVGCATTQSDGQTWNCRAQNLVTANYNGGSTAYVHLQGFSSGGTYPVTQNKDKTMATGTTANGTPFTCEVKK